MRIPVGLTTVLILGLGLGPAAARADTRFGCMAESGSIKLGIHVEFSDELGGRLSHLTGKMALAGADTPLALAEVALHSDMVSQAWSGSGKLLMRFYDEEVDGAPLYISLAAVAQGGDPAKMHGTYTLKRVAANRIRDFSFV